jgi:heme exporter protein A
MIAAHNLSKSFGPKRVFSKVELVLAPGAFLLVTGPNGSGKSTLLRVLAGLSAPTAGELELPERHLVGYLGHDPLVYRELTPLENLTLFARLYRVAGSKERIALLLEQFALWERRNDRVSTFSRGMQQRLALCRTLLHEPQLLLLDEPFNALDADGAALLDGTLEGLAGRTFVVATHDPERVERLASERLALG